MPPVIPPIPDLTDEFFWDGVQRGELLLQRCAGCGELRLPPVPMCGTCHALAWDAVAATGGGSLYSWVLSRHPSEPDVAPRLVALVHLDEGVRVVSNLCDVDAADVHNDMRVELCFRTIDGVVLPQFRPAPAATGIVGP